MKNALILLALVVISILYMFEVDYSNVELLNWVAFAIIFLTILYVAVSIAVGRERRIARREQKKNNGKFIE